jgi:hypothetical protein
VHAYGYTEEVERFPIDYEVLFLPIRLPLHQKRKASVAGESYHLVFSTNIREQKGFGLKMKTQGC